MHLGKVLVQNAGVGWHSLWYINVNGRLGVNRFQVWGRTCSILQKKVLTQNENCQRCCVSQYSSCCWGCSWTCSSPSCSSVWLSCREKKIPKHSSAESIPHGILPHGAHCSIKLNNFHVRKYNMSCYLRKPASHNITLKCTYFASDWGTCSTGISLKKCQLSASLPVICSGEWSFWTIRWWYASS